MPDILNRCLLSQVNLFNAFDNHRLMSFFLREKKCLFRSTTMIIIDIPFSSSNWIELKFLRFKMKSKMEYFNFIIYIHIINNTLIFDLLLSADGDDRISLSKSWSSRNSRYKKTQIQIKTHYDGGLYSIGNVETRQHFYMHRIWWWWWGKIDNSVNSAIQNYSADLLKFFNHQMM